MVLGFEKHNNFMEKGGYPCFYIDDRDIQNRRFRVACAEPPYMP